MGSVYIAVYYSQFVLLVLFTFIFRLYFLTTFALSSWRMRHVLFTKNRLYMSEKKKLLSTKEAAEYCGFKLSYFRFKAFILEQTFCTWSSPYNIERESIPIQENKVWIFWYSLTM